MDVVQRAWLRQSRTEYTAASLVAEMTHWMCVVGLSPDLLVRATRVVSDEVRHATICHELYLHAGGAPTPVSLVPRQLIHADDPEAPMHLRLITAAGELACEESVALTVFRMRLENATDPMARDVCEVILRDESTHRVFAFDVLDALSELYGLEPVRAWVRPRLCWWLRIYLRAKLRDEEPRYEPSALAFGLIDRREHWQAMRETVESKVIPAFQKRGLLEPEATGELLTRELETFDPRAVGGAVV